LDVRPPTNIVQPGGRDSSTVWLDLEEKDPARRFKMFRVIGAGEDPVTKWNNWQMAIHFSADGIHWREPVAKTGRLVDRSTVFWNPFRHVWVYSIRHVYKVGDSIDNRYGFARRRSYVEGPDLLSAANWTVNEPLRWTDIDRLDPQRDDLKIKPQLYNLDAVGYESLMVGFFTVWRGQPADRHKPNNVVLGYSRDGWHWSRPDRRAFCPVSDKQGDWNANNVGEGTPATRQVYQYDFSLGGPVKRDRTWFFAALRFTDNKSGTGRTPELVAIHRAIIPSQRGAIARNARKKTRPNSAPSRHHSALVM